MKKFLRHIWIRAWSKGGIGLSRIQHRFKYPSLPGRVLHAIGKVYGEAHILARRLVPALVVLLIGALAACGELASQDDAAPDPTPTTPVGVTADSAALFDVMAAMTAEYLAMRDLHHRSEIRWKAYTEQCKELNKWVLDAAINRNVDQFNRWSAQHTMHCHHSDTKYIHEWFGLHEPRFHLEAISDLGMALYWSQVVHNHGVIEEVLGAPYLWVPVAWSDERLRWEYTTEVERWNDVMEASITLDEPNGKPLFDESGNYIDYETSAQ